MYDIYEWTVGLINMALQRGVSRSSWKIDNSVRMLKPWI